MFQKEILFFKTNLYKELSESIQFEDLTNGRKGAILVEKKKDCIPIIRTTSVYKNKVQQFLPIHYDIINSIKKFRNFECNNAMIEIYDNNYIKMKYHSDQALDLMEDSYICVFSCYSNPEKRDIRKLVIKEKESQKESEITMEHNSIVLFSTLSNKKHLHKIIGNELIDDQKWLGITFRLSKTYITFINEIPYFVSNKKEIVIATENEKRYFYNYKSTENKSIEFIYPEINYTTSPSDLIN